MRFSEGSTPRALPDTTKLIALGASLVIGMVGRRTIETQDGDLDLLGDIVSCVLLDDPIDAARGANDALAQRSNLVRGYVGPEEAGNVPGDYNPVLTAVLVGGIGRRGPEIALAVLTLEGPSDIQVFSRQGSLVLSPASVYDDLRAACERARGVQTDESAVDVLVEAVRQASSREYMLVSPQVDLAIVRGNHVTELRRLELPMKPQIPRH